MPAIAPIEDLRAAQKEGLSINAMLCGFSCAMRYVYLPKAELDRRQAPCGVLVWAGERTPEQLKGEGG